MNADNKGVFPDLERLLQLLGDPTRLRLLTLVHLEHELCVCELTFATGLPQSTISRALTLLLREGVLQRRRFEQWMFYSLRQGWPEAYQNILSSVLEMSSARPQSREDQARIRRMTDRPQGCGRCHV